MNDLKSILEEADKTARNLADLKHEIDFLRYNEKMSEVAKLQQLFKDVRTSIHDLEYLSTLISAQYNEIAMRYPHVIKGGVMP